MTSIGKGKIIHKIINAITTVLVALLVVFAIMLVIPKVSAIDAYVVMSGSMEPAYKTGSLIYTTSNVDCDELEIGDVITYKLNESTVATHRIVGISSSIESENGMENETIMFQTKGDANEIPDPNLVPEQNVVGKALFSIPYLGYVVDFIQPTQAWMADSHEIKNTFTAGRAGIDLNETDIDEDGNTKKNTYKMLPGGEYTKNPTVTVAAGSEDVYVRMLLTIHNASAMRDIVVDSKNEIKTFVDFLGGLNVDAWNMSKLTQNKKQNTVTYEFRYKVPVRSQDDKGAPLSEDILLEPLFEQLLIPTGLTKGEMSALKSGGFKITAEAQAMQVLGYKNAAAAWAAFEAGKGLSARTTSIENTFTYGDINIQLSETDTKDDYDERTNTYTFTPGAVIAKDPQVTVSAGSEKSWLFVKVEKNETFDNFLYYEIADGWIPLEGESGVYYRKIDDTSRIQTFKVLKDNSVCVKPEVTQEQMDMLTEDAYPVLDITSYAVQQLKVDSAEKAWEITQTKTHLQDDTAPLKNIFIPVQTQDHNVDIKVTGEKTLLGREWQAGDAFIFMLQMWDEEKSSWDTIGTESVIYDDGAGFADFDFSDLVSYQLNESGNYFFRIVEGRGNLSGMSYDTAIREFAVIVSSNESGILSIEDVLDMENTDISRDAESGIFEVSMNFVNTYVPPHEPPVRPYPDSISVDFNINKIVKNIGGEGIEPAGFHFRLEKNSTGQSWTVTSDEKGEAVFHMTYDADDAGKVFIYRLSESDDGWEGVTYDSRDYEIRVGITLDESSNRLVSKIDLDGIAVDEVKVDFVNVYDSAVDSDGPEQPSEPSEPSDPVVPPSDPTEPDEPSEPSEPVVPPSDPTEPDEPSEPSEPVVPPSDPTEPDEPSEPSEPVVPPSDPTMPDLPIDPDIPTIGPESPDDDLDHDDPETQSGKDYGAQTGDEFTLFLYIILLLTSAAILILLMASKKETCNE